MTWFVGGQRLDIQAGQVDEYQLGNPRVECVYFHIWSPFVLAIRISLFEN